MTESKSDEGPLSAEALARDEWRDDNGGAKAPGHTQPASESDGSDDEDRADGPNPIAGTMLPPD